MAIGDEQGRAVPSGTGPLQTGTYSKPIKPGQTAILFDKWDLRNQCKLTRPGRYKVQFRGGLHVAEADPHRSILVHRPGSKTIETQPATGRRSRRLFPSNIVEIEVVATQPASRPWG